MLPHPLASLAALLVVAMLVGVGALPPSDAAPEPAGHWEILGEDGRVWVPRDVPATTALPGPGLGAYHDPDETTAALMATATARPDLFTMTRLGTSVQGRPIWLMQVTGPGDASARPRVLLDGAHHGDEVIGSETLTRLLLAIAAGHDSDPTMRAILAEVVLDVVPMVNVDGVALVPDCTHYAMCRKNANGVDLNRNYPDHWGGSGSSGDPGSATYRGTAPLSEPESAALAALIDANDYALHASFHSGTELILWPYGWTTASPPEESVYEALGDALTALTGVPHGQTARVLYTASGTTMDQAYGMAAGWRPISISPETYEGSGNAFDWWLLFNPPETDATIQPVVERWWKLVWYLADVAPEFRPAGLEVPAALEIGPDEGALSFVVSPPTRRPLVGASLSFEADGAPVQVTSQHPVGIPALGASGAFTLLAERGGAYGARVLLDAGPAGLREEAVALTLVQVGLGITLEKEIMGTPHQNTATATVSAGPFMSVEGTLTFRAEPDGLAVGSSGFTATPGADATVPVTFDATGLSQGAHRMVVEADFTAVLDGLPRPGFARAEAPFTVVRPEVTVNKVFAATGPIGRPLPVLSVYRNEGGLAARDVVVRETVPAGHVYWFRDGPVPVPSSPLGSPQPDEVALGPDGAVELVWRLGDLPPGGGKALRYRLLPLVPGEAVLTSAWSYEGDFGDVVVPYEASIHPVYETT